MGAHAHAFTCEFVDFTCPDTPNSLSPLLKVFRKTPPELQLKTIEHEILEESRNNAWRRETADDRCRGRGTDKSEQARRLYIDKLSESFIMSSWNMLSELQVKLQ